MTRLTEAQEGIREKARELAAAVIGPSARRSLASVATSSAENESSNR